MLRTLLIRDFITVTSLELDLQPGFTVLTGETGAGKSILFDALGLLLGDRADSAMVRPGAARADISAEFTPSEPQLTQLAEQLEQSGLEGVENTLILRRVVESGGRSRAWINGQMASLTQLKDLGEMLVNLHGQHAHQALLKPNAQLRLLDHQGGLLEQALKVRQAYQALSAAKSALDRAREQAGALASIREQALWRLQEIEALKIQAGEWEALTLEHKRLSHGAELISEAESALTLVEEGDQSLLGQVQRLASRFSGLMAKDERLKPVQETLEAAGIQLGEASSNLSRYLDKADLDPERLAIVERRVGEIFDLARKLRCQPEALLNELEAARNTLAQTEAAADVDGLEKTLDAATALFHSLANELSGARRVAAQKLSQEVSGWLNELAMKGSSFEVALESRDQPAAHGLEDVVFMLNHQGQERGQPVAKIASGGELSRVSLAIAVVAAQATDVPTLLFDEVDAGIGGNTGHVVGRLLRTLGESHQVLAVTHLPQVASRGHQHLQVRKDLHSGLPTSEVIALHGDARAAEVARMLGDEGLEDRSLELAKELLSL
ncbi:MAG: DNA repair protein RecN [Betaproteobacteria bacterium]|nr:DNA repair protein RecN [Betaproteobacteria bacterium]